MRVAIHFQKLESKSGLPSTKARILVENSKVCTEKKLRDMPGFWRDVPGQKITRAPSSARHACTLARRACTRPPDHTTGRPDRHLLRDEFSPKDAAQVLKVFSIVSAFKSRCSSKFEVFYMLPHQISRF